MKFMRCPMPESPFVRKHLFTSIRRAAGKLGGVNGATGSYEANLCAIARSQAVTVVDIGNTQGEGFKHRGSLAGLRGLPSRWV